MHRIWGGKKFHVHHVPSMNFSKQWKMTEQQQNKPLRDSS